MIWQVVILVVAGVLSGPIFAEISRVWLRRSLGWAVLAGVVYGIDSVLSESDAIIRMVGICCGLLGAMKALVYAEWVGRKKLLLTRYLVFSFLWFGMDAASFRERRASLGWISDIGVGAVLMIFGTLGAWLVWWMDWRQILVMFVPMSIGFHFGALRVLKGILRATGFPVRTLFPNVLKAQGVGDFWSRRWNVGYSQMMQRLIGRPISTLAGENVGTLAVFAASGLLHELAITLPVKSGFGLPTLYFVFHGLLTLFEKNRGRQFGRIPALLAVVLPLGFLFPKSFQTEIIARCLAVFDLLQSVYLS